MTVDVLVRGGLVMLPEAPGPRRLDVAIDGERVVALLEPAAGERVEARTVHELDGELVTPGAIDPHVHVHWPFLGSRTADDYRSASIAAAAGGTTTVIDFALEGREDPLAAIARRRGEAEGSSVVDFGLHLVVSEATDDVLAALPEVLRSGVTSVKCYMTYRARGLAVSDRTLHEVCRVVGAHGGVVGVHAESAELDELGRERAQAEGRGAAHHLPDAKGPLVEVEAVTRAATIAAAAGAPLWILHLSSAQGLAAALEARRRLGRPTALETCPQYLLLDRSMLARPGGHRWLCSPPLREAPSPPALMQALAEGTIDWVGSDHCCFTTAQKDARAGAFWECPHGFPGVETRAPLVLAAAADGRLGLGRAVQALCSAPARFFGLYPRKGTLLPGSDADLVVWSSREPERLTVERLRTPSDWTPFEGQRALPAPRLVLVRGLSVVGDGVEAPVGHGRFLRRGAGAWEAPA